MSEQSQLSNSMYCFLPTETEGFGPLAELALDMRWSWNRYGDDVWQRLDPDLWELTRNPWVVLQTASRGKLRQMLADAAFRKKVDALVQTRRQAEETPAWFQQTYPQSPLTCVAYFSMEFMLSEALPIYSGGLGNVAGDQLKAASDLGIPVVGGWRLLHALGIQAEVCHLNEGHAAFAVLERARSFMQETGQPFEVALAVTRAGDLFATHTAVAAGCRRAADKGVMGRRMVDWRHALEGSWSKLRFGDVSIQTNDGQHVFDVTVYLCDLDPEAVRVELYADGFDGVAPLRQEMTCVRQLAGAPGPYVYSTSVSAARPPADFTVRVIPRCNGAMIPLEDARILWQR